MLQKRKRNQAKLRALQVLSAAALASCLPDGPTTTDVGQGSAGQGTGGSGTGGRGSGGTEGDTCIIDVGICNVEQQCGCPKGESCYSVTDEGSTSTACFTPGTTPAYHACKLDRDCQKGLVCSVGACAPACDPKAIPGSASRGQGACELAEASCIEIEVRRGERIHVCSSVCDLTNPHAGDGGFNACGPGVNCTIASYGDHTWETHCTAGELRAGFACDLLADRCGPGLACSFYGKCEEPLLWCEAGTNTCPGGAACSDGGEMFYYGKELGICP